MAKFHINAKGVPAPCKATKGNCPYGGSTGTENHFNSIEEAQEFADNKNEAEFSMLPGVKNQAGMDTAEKGKYFATLINDRVPEPQLREGSIVIHDDLDSSIELYDEFITCYENDPIAESEEMFDYLSHKKIYRYDESRENPLDNFISSRAHGAYSWRKRMDNHELHLESEDYFDEDYGYGEEGRVQFRESVRKKGELMDYTEKLTLEYARDFQNNIFYGSDKDEFDLDYLDDMKEEYKKNLSKQISKFINDQRDDGR